MTVQLHSFRSDFQKAGSEIFGFPTLENKWSHKIFARPINFRVHVTFWNKFETAGGVALSLLVH